MEDAMVIGSVYGIGTRMGGSEHNQLRSSGITSRSEWRCSPSTRCDA
jgi:hypothetical protein